MLRTVKIKIQPDQSVMLKTMEVYSIVFNRHVDWALENKSFNKQKAHEALYAKSREEFPELPSAMVQCARDNALESIHSIISANRNKLKKKKKKFSVDDLWNIENPPRKRPRSAIRYDKRTLTLRGHQMTMSTSAKRFKQILEIPEYFKHIVDTWKFKGGQLSFDGSQFWLHLIFETNSPELLKGESVTGVDRGIYNIATTSDGKKYSGKRLMGIRRKHLHNRQTLQAKGTRSAKRRLKRMKGKEKRFSKQENHVISKQIVQHAGNIIVLEDLSKIEGNKGKKMNKWLSNWKFYEQELFLVYKAEATGKRIEFVDARYTSQKCSACKYVSKKNRSGSKFCCVRCGYTDHADVNAAKNIRDNYIISTLECRAGLNASHQSDDAPGNAARRVQSKQAPSLVLGVS